MYVTLPALYAAAIVAVVCLILCVLWGVWLQQRVPARSYRIGRRHR